MEIKEKKTKSIAHNISLRSQGLPQTSFFKKIIIWNMVAIYFY